MIGRAVGAAIAAPAALALLLAIVGSVTSLMQDRRRLANRAADGRPWNQHWTGRQ
jgi:hypothetical protein